MIFLFSSPVYLTVIGCSKKNLAVDHSWVWKDSVLFFYRPTICRKHSQCRQSWEESTHAPTPSSPSSGVVLHEWMPELRDDSTRRRANENVWWWLGSKSCSRRHPRWEFKDIPQNGTEPQVTLKFRVQNSQFSAVYHSNQKKNKLFGVLGRGIYMYNTVPKSNTIKNYHW